jgi:glycosyltransferase 2 family protein
MATETSPDAGTSPAAAPDRRADGDRQYEFARSSRDLLRLVGGLILLLLGLVLATIFADALLGFETDLTRAVRGLPEGLAVIVLGTIRVLSLLAALGLVAWLAWRRRWKLLGRLLLASVVALVLLVGVDRLIGVAPAPSLEAIPRAAWVTGLSSGLGSGNVAVAVAVYMVARPLLTVPYRRLVVWVIALTTLHVILAGSDLPRDLVAAIACGFVAASSVLLALGRPIRPLEPDQVAAALRRTSIDVTGVQPAAVDARGSRPFFGTLAGGGGVFVKVLGREERSSDLLFRFYRWLRFRGLGDEAVASSLKQSIEQEALVSALAADDGIRTPRLLGVAEVDTDRLALAFVRIEGSSLDGEPVERLGDDVLRGIWRLVADLHRAGIAHRDLRLANLMVDDRGQPWLVDFGFGTVAARPQQLAGDVAELLCSMAVAVGPKRTVDAAVAELRPEQIQAALPRLQPDALSAATRKAMKAHKGLSKQLQETAAAAVGVEKVQLLHLERVQPRHVLILLTTAFAAYLLIRQVTQTRDLPATLARMDWGWAILALVASALTYVGAALNLVGGFGRRLSLGLTTAVQLGGSFINLITPVKVGGTAVNIRYLQKQGLDSAAAIGGMGVTIMVVGIMHVALTVVFLVWAGSKTSVVKLPSSSTVLLVLVVVAAIIGLAVAIRPARRLIRTVLIPQAEKAVLELREALRDPARLSLSFVGALLMELAYIGALFASVRAFGYPVSFAAAGAVYLAGSAVASAAPTPGGVGAVEAALIAGLTATGVPTEQAVPAVLVYRVATFWLTVPSGWLSFTLLTRRDVL